MRIGFLRKRSKKKVRIERRAPEEKKAPAKAKSPKRKKAPKKKAPKKKAPRKAKVTTPNMPDPSVEYGALVPVQLLRAAAMMTKRESNFDKAEPYEKYIWFWEGGWISSTNGHMVFKTRTNHEILHGAFPVALAKIAAEAHGDEEIDAFITVGNGRATIETPLVSEQWETGHPIDKVSRTSKWAQWAKMYPNEAFFDVDYLEAIVAAAKKQGADSVSLCTYKRDDFAEVNPPDWIQSTRVDFWQREKLPKKKRFSNYTTRLKKVSSVLLAACLPSTSLVDRDEAWDEDPFSTGR